MYYAYLLCILTNNQLVVDLFEYLKATTKIYRHAPCRQLLQMSERDAKARIDLESMRSACHGFCSREAQATYTFPGIVCTGFCVYNVQETQ